MSGEALRPAGEADLPALAALHARAFPPDERWGAVAIGAMLGLEGGFGLLAGPDPAPGGADPSNLVPSNPVPSGFVPAGFVLARAVAGEAEILTLAVDPAARRRGHGARLLRAAAEVAAERGADSLFLEVSEANGPARALYARAGAEEVGRRRRYYTDGTDALVLRIRPAALIHPPS